MIIYESITSEKHSIYGMGFMRFCLFLCAGLLCLALPLSGEESVDSLVKHCNRQKLAYYLYISDFAESFISIQTTPVTDPTSTLSSRYLAGRAPLYDADDLKVGTCSASFLCMQNEDDIYTDISNYLSVDNGLIVSWFTPTTLIDLELDSIIHGMVTECIVKASTKIGFNPFYGKSFNLVVSSDDEKIYFVFTKI